MKEVYKRKNQDNDLHSLKEYYTVDTNSYSIGFIICI